MYIAQRRLVWPNPLQFDSTLSYMKHVYIIHFFSGYLYVCNRTAVICHVFLYLLLLTFAIIAKEVKFTVAEEQLELIGTYLTCKCLQEQHLLCSSRRRTFSQLYTGFHAISHWQQCHLVTSTDNTASTGSDATAGLPFNGEHHQLMGKMVGKIIRKGGCQQGTIIMQKLDGMLPCPNDLMNAPWVLRLPWGFHKNYKMAPLYGIPFQDPKKPVKMAGCQECQAYLE